MVEPTLGKPVCRLRELSMKNEHHRGFGMARAEALAFYFERSHAAALAARPEPLFAD